MTEQVSHRRRHRGLVEFVCLDVRLGVMNENETEGRMVGTPERRKREVCYEPLSGLCHSEGRVASTQSLPLQRLGLRVSRRFILATNSHDQESTTAIFLQQGLNKSQFGNGVTVARLQYWRILTPT